MKRYGYGYVLGVLLLLIIVLLTIYFQRETFKNQNHAGSNQNDNVAKLINILKKYPDDKYIKSIPLTKERDYSSLNAVEKLYADNKTKVKKFVFNKKIKEMTPAEKDLFVNTIIRTNFGPNTFQNLFGYTSLENMYTKFKDYSSRRDANKVIRRFIPAA